MKRKFNKIVTKIKKHYIKNNNNKKINKERKKVKQIKQAPTNR